MLSNGLLEGAVSFHGHLGPFLVLGLRAGLIGVGYLGKSYFELRATVETGIQPPRSCFIDGIQFASGCTTGKCNLQVVTDNDVSVEFVRGERRIRITIRDNILRDMNHLSSEEQVERFSREILEKTANELFLVEKE